MYKPLGILLAVILVIIALPALIVRGCEWKGGKEMKGAAGPLIRVYVHKTGQIATMPLEEYLVGVVAAEMPASFEPEALKAQAVAARTYALKRKGLPNPFHPGADICTDHIHAQAWISREQMKKNWGPAGYLSHYRQIRRAVEETAGQVITYGGHLIDPVYHAACGGKGTENSEEVWKYPVPYLRGVDCPEEQDHRAARGEVVLTFEEVDRILGTGLSSLPVSAGKGTSKAFTVLARTSRGRVKTARIGGKVFDSSQLRAFLGLRSTDFSWQVEGNRIKFITKGNGHAVGLCQYGANALAKKGQSYREILAYYYQGTHVARYLEEK